MFATTSFRDFGEFDSTESLDFRDFHLSHHIFAISQTRIIGVA